MNRSLKTIFATLLFAGASCLTISARESQTVKRAPTLTADDVQASRNPSALPSTPVKNEWAQYPLREIGLSIELPAEPILASSVELPTGRVMTFYSIGHGLKVFIVRAPASSSQEAGDLITGVFDGLGQRGLTDFRIDFNRNSPAKKIPMTGSGKIHGADVEFKGVALLARPREVLLVFSEYPKSNAAGKADGARVVASVQINR